MRIDRRVLAATATAIKKGKINADFSTDMGKIEAMFLKKSVVLGKTNHAANTLWLNYALYNHANRMSVKSLLLHECVHAYSHVFNKFHSTLIDETAAYLTQTKYYLLADPVAFVKYLRMMKKRRQTGILKLYLACYRAIHNFGYRGSPKRFLDEEHLREVMRAIAALPPYTERVVPPLPK